MTDTLLLEDDVLEDVVSDPIGYQFTAWDRCDGTASEAEQAYHRLTKGEQEMFLCSHHYNINEDVLLTAGWAVESDVKALADLGVKNYIYSEV